MERSVKAALAVATIAIVGFFAYRAFEGRETMKVLKIGFPEHWGENLSPSLQHTIYADAIMANEYEALVTIGPAGSIRPLAAKSWTVSPDKRIFTFKIDTKKKFSNGQQLTAQTFKDSWEHGLTLPPKSANSSLQDILYKVVGYDDFAATKKLRGLRVIDEETFEVEFQNPFRAALTNLAGSRMAAFVIDNGKTLGTGPYVIVENTSENVMLVANPMREGPYFKKVTVEVIKPDSSQSALDSDRIDAYGMAEQADFKNCLDEGSTIGCFAGNESRHVVLALNSRPDRFFRKKEHRLALQALVYKIFMTKDLPETMKLKTVLDPQIFLPMQAGHIENEEAMAIIEKGEPFIADFVKDTERRPVTITAGTSDILLNWIKDGLSAHGVKFSDQSGIITMKELAETYYKKWNTDILLMTMSVASGDPDGIYHVLGENGAISSPMLFKKETSGLLEEGRRILDSEKIAEHYQKVTKAALAEVPFVHLGYLKTLMVYRRDKVQLDKTFKQREDSRFSSFQPL